MYLTTEEEKALSGEYGWAREVAMKILVKLGDLFGADRLIPIQSAHISGVSYKTVGDAATEFIAALAESGGRASTKTTVNPAAFDLDDPYITGATDQRIEAQMRILRLYEKIGVDLTLTCTPYYLKRPSPNTHLAWAESSAVIYANSILNSWTNREGGPSALAASIIGKTPNYGMHRAESRKGEINVVVQADLKGMEEYGALGILLGEIIGDKVPIITGLKNVSEERLKQLCAALGSSGMASRFIVSDTPNRNLKEKITVERKDITETIEKLSGSFDSPDLVFIGCPHCSPSEIIKIAEFIKNRKIKSDTQLWICTSRHIKRAMDSYVKVIEGSGGKVLCDTCIVVSWIRDAGIERMMTNSAKTAYYAPTMNRVEVALKPLRECLEAACKA